MPRNPDGTPEEDETVEADVDEESEESFPASDPPSHWAGSTGESGSG